MLNGSENKRTRNCWLERTELEKGLLIFLVIAILLTTTLVILILLHTKSSTDGCQNEGGSSSHENNSDSGSESCDSQVCIKAALKILSRIDTEINPCEDFYAFACNNMPKTTQEPFHELLELEKLTIEDMYKNEPIQENDHPLVKVQKQMYEACMNESAIAEEAFQTLVEVIRAVGGWPVVEQFWNPKKFDWVQTTYKLRQLGYAYNSFFDVKIVRDPEDSEKYIFQVSVPTVEDVYSKWFDSDKPTEFMTQVAIAFGAQSHQALVQMSKTYQFLEQLQSTQKIKDKGMHRRVTVAEFQRTEDTVEWIQFINTIVSPYARVSRKDFVLFPSEAEIDEWIGILDRTDDEILANYMMWRVVEEALPHLTQHLLNGGVIPRLMVNMEGESRSEFCIKEIRKSFSPSPIDIMYLRKYVPEVRRQAVEELANNIQKGLIDVAKKSEWLDPKYTEAAVEGAYNASLIVGAPGSYFDDEIFDSMNYDLDVSNNNFLKMLSQARRNNLDRLYGLIDKSTRKTEIVWRDVAGYYTMYENPDEITIMASMVQDPVFNEKQPNYLNYATMGMIARYFFLEFFYGRSPETRKAMDRYGECLVSATFPESNSTFEYKPSVDLITHNLGLKASYAAYKKWAKDHEEPLLAAIDYTPEQLFWMASGYFFCHYADSSITNDLDTESKAAYASIVAMVINDNRDLARDFECPEKPEPTCNLF